MITLSLTKDGLALVLGKSTLLLYPRAPKPDTLSLLREPEEAPSRDVVSWPGEYDVSGVSIRGIEHREGQFVSYVLTAEGVRIAAPSSPLEEWTDLVIELLGDVHVLLLPAADPKICQRLLDEVDPRMLILLPADDGALHPDVLKMCSATEKAPVNEIKLKGSFAAEGRDVAVMG